MGVQVSSQERAVLFVFHLINTMAAFNGKFKQVSSSDLSDYYLARGVPDQVIPMLVEMKAGLQISSDDSGQWVITFKTPMKDHTLQFQLGEEFAEIDSMST